MLKPMAGIGNKSCTLVDLSVKARGSKGVLRGPEIRLIELRYSLTNLYVRDLPLIDEWWRPVAHREGVPSSADDSLEPDLSIGLLFIGDDFIHDRLNLGRISACKPANMHIRVKINPVKIIAIMVYLTEPIVMIRIPGAELPEGIIDVSLEKVREDIWFPPVRVRYTDW